MLLLLSVDSFMVLHKKEQRKKASLSDSCLNVELCCCSVPVQNSTCHTLIGVPNDGNIFVENSIMRHHSP